MCVILINVVLIYLICRFLSRFGGLVIGHECVGECEVSVFRSMCIDQCPVDNFVCDRCWFVEYAGQFFGDKGHVISETHGQPIQGTHVAAVFIVGFMWVIPADFLVCPTRCKDVAE
jgi:hypothetical protein